MLRWKYNRNMLQLTTQEKGKININFIREMVLIVFLLMVSMSVMRSGSKLPLVNKIHCHDCCRTLS